jgi:hypothetical protein
VTKEKMSAVDIKKSKKQFFDSNSSVSTSYAWIHHVCEDERDLLFKKELVKQIIDAVQSLMTVFDEFNISKKSYIQTFMKTARAFIENIGVNYNQGRIYDEIKEELDDLIARIVKFFYEIENNVGGYETFCEGIKQDADDKSFVDDISQASFKQKMAEIYRTIYDLLKPSDGSMVKLMASGKSKSQSSMIQKYIEDNYDELCKTIMKTRGSIANAVNDMIDDASKDMVDMLCEVQTAAGALFSTSKMWEGKQTNVGVSKIKEALVKLLGLMRKVNEADKDIKFFDKMPDDFVNIINNINNSAKTTKKVVSRSSSTNDPWTRKVRITKKRNPDASVGDATSEPAKRGKTIRDMDTKTKYREKHRELYPTYNDFVNSVDLENAHVVASDFVKKFIEDLFEELKFPEDMQKHIFQHVPFNDKFEEINENPDEIDPRYDSYQSANEIMKSIFAKDRDILMPTDYALRIGNGFYGDDGNCILICAWINASDPKNPDVVHVSPVKVSIDAEKKIKIVPVSQLIRQASAKMVKSGSSLPLAPVTPKRRESKPKQALKDDDDDDNAESSNVPELNIFERHLEMYSKMVRFAKINPNMDTKAIGDAFKKNLAKFVEKNFNNYKKDEKSKGYNLIFGRLIKPSDEINDTVDESQIHGILVKPDRLIEFVKEPGIGMTYLYPTTTYILRRFDTNVDDPSVEPKVYQLYMVYSNSGEGSVLNTPDGKSKYGFFGFIESPNVFRVIRDFGDIDTINQTLINAKHGVAKFPQKDHKKMDHKSDESPYAMSEPDHWEIVDAKIVAPQKGKAIAKMLKKPVVDDEESNPLGIEF